MSPRPDLRQAARFLSALTGQHDGPCTFQCFDDTPAKRPELARILHGRLIECSDELEALNERGAGVFVCVNETDLRGRREENVTALRALFVDVDDSEPRTWALPPDILVQSARGVHAYWLLDAGEPLSEFAAGQKRAAAYYRSDPVIHDLPRVMRLPGFYHRKNEPTLVQLLEVRGSVAA
jgi:hypothetical protein